MSNSNTSSLEKALFILKHTNDGNALCPLHLKLVELSINGQLSESGTQAFEKLFSNTLSGYKKPFFHNIEHLTIDTQGFVYWKNTEVEHYSLSWAFSDEAQKAAQTLGNRCKSLETSGTPVNTSTAIWQWK